MAAWLLCKAQLPAFTTHRSYSGLLSRRDLAPLADDVPEKQGPSRLEKIGDGSPIQHAKRRSGSKSLDGKPPTSPPPAPRRHPNHTSTIKLALNATVFATHRGRCYSPYQTTVTHYSPSYLAPIPGPGADSDPDACPLTTLAAGSALCWPASSTLASNSSIFFSSCVSWLSIADAVFSPLLAVKAPHRKSQLDCQDNGTDLVGHDWDHECRMRMIRVSVEAQVSSREIVGRRLSRHGFRTLRWKRTLPDP